MNKKGFTLIEILAVIIILGIVATIGIAAITRNIDKSRKSSFVNIARNYVESARAMRTEDKLPIDISNGRILVMPFSSITGVQLENADETPYGDLDMDYCYIIVYNKDNKNYSYYVTMKDTSNHGINMVEVNDLQEKSVILDENNEIKNIESLTYIEIDGVNFSISYNGIQRDENNKIKYVEMELPR